ncbi:MAG TPA: PQQ-binding-like beta-propeller repeat protein, partial [Ktedonobacterales bacterium]|nr:PQQ-binding-like beta-propeller repeat protein [Ktedonobacterales bacterium]
IVVADATGAVTTSFWVSAAAAKSYTVALQGLTSGTVATASYQLTSSLDLGAYVGPTGTALRLRGWGFAAKEAIQVYWNYQQSGQVVAAKASTDSKGDWSGKTFVVPSTAPAGTYTVAAVGTTSHLVATSQYTVGAAPQGAAPGPNDWAVFGYDLQDTRVNSAETTISQTNVNTLAIKWAATSPIKPYLKVVDSPVVANGVVYYGTSEGQMLAYDLSGNLLWTFNATAPIYGSPAVGNGLVYFGTVKNPAEDTTGNYIYALNAATGALVWENYLTLGSLWVPPTFYNGVVYAQTALKEGTSGGLYAFNALTGAIIWSQATKSGDWSVPIFDPSGANMYIATGNPCLSSPPPGNNTPLTDGCSGSLLDLNPATGATVWSYHFPDYSGDDDAPATPVYAVVNGTPELFEGVKNGLFYCLNATTGVVVWQYDTGNRGDSGIYSSAAYYNGVVYFGGFKTLYALNAADGSVAWTYQPVGTIVSSPAIANGVLYVGTESGYLAALSTDAAPVKRELWYHRFTNLTIYGSPAVSNGAVYIAVSDGNLYAFTLNGQ